jgi:glycerol-3-phosphate O-acyltransferase
VTGINAAAAVTPINLVAMAMLATPRQALPETVVRQLELYQRLLREAPYSPLVTVTRCRRPTWSVRRIDGHARAAEACRSATSCA